MKKKHTEITHLFEYTKKSKDKISKIDFNRMELDTKHFVNNLTLSKGISPWVKEELDKPGIITFAKINNS
jgi:predicted flap endonuclease-1-like 5' DNA nuclease